MLPLRLETDRSKEKGAIQLEWLSNFFTNGDSVRGVMMKDRCRQNGVKNRRKEREWKRFENIVPRVLIVGGHDGWSAVGIGVVATSASHVRSQPNDKDQ